MLRRIASLSLTLILVVGVLSTVFTIHPVKAGTITVPDDYSTIQEAINHADEGDMIFVRSGAYYENIVVNKTVFLVGEDKENTIINGGRRGITVCLNCVNNAGFSGFTITGSGRVAGSNDAGCYLNHSNGNSIVNNRIEDNFQGILMAYSSYNIILRNTVVSNKWTGLGIWAASTSNAIRDNILFNNTYGIYLMQSWSNVLRNNSLSDNKYNFGCYGGSSYQLVNDIDATNKANDKTIYYLVQQKNLVISPLTFPDIGYLALIECDNIVVSGISLSNNVNGILCAGTSNTYVTNVSCSGNMDGIELVDCQNVTFSGTVFDACRNEAVFLQGCRGVSILDSEFQSAGGLCIYHSTSSNISRNYFQNGWCGLRLYYSDYNAISENTWVEDQNSASYVVADSCYNRVYHNTFLFYSGIWPIPQHNFRLEGTSANNMWDDGYPSGGNYWSDYNGTDKSCGPHQNMTGRDGIGDIPYVIDEGAQDNYPLAKPFGNHDLGVTSVGKPRDFVWQGFTVCFNVTVTNFGYSNEKSNLTFSIGAIVIGHETIALSGHSSAVLAFTWNTTGIAGGEYAVVACIAQVAGETDLSDNTCTGGGMLVMVTGDVNHDGTVNIYDIVCIALIYGSRNGEPSWNPNADIAEPFGVINIFDVVTCASHYGEKYP